MVPGMGQMLSGVVSVECGKNFLLDLFLAHSLLSWWPDVSPLPLWRWEREDGLSWGKAGWLTSVRGEGWAG
jgi:hypothetical protein